jgi:hypothetical protein
MPRSSRSSPRVPVPIPPIKTNPTVVSHNSGFVSNMVQGFALGTGQSLAFNLFRSVSATPATAATLEAPVKKESYEYTQCMLEYSDKDICKVYLS